MYFQRPSNTMNRALLDWLVELEPDILHAIVVFREHYLAPIRRRLAAYQRHQRTPLENMIRRLAAEVFDEGRRQIDRLDQRIADRAPCAVGCIGGIDHDQRNLGGWIVEQILLAHPVVAEIVAVI